MKAKKIIRYRLPVSVNFPATHLKAGELTYFEELIHAGQKKHTIRTNYALWAKRFEKISRGDAVIELYYWSGKPYRSKAITISQRGKEHGVGIQKLVFMEDYWCNPVLVDENDFCTGLISKELAKNDGLSLEDFRSWFIDYDLSKPMAIIHFANFRY